MKDLLLRAGSIVALSLAVACTQQPGTADTAVPSPAQASNVMPGFINKVWEVSVSTGVAPGMLQVQAKRQQCTTSAGTGA